MTQQHTPWNVIDTLTIICITNHHDAMLFWQCRHPNVNPHLYTCDPNLRRFWNSRLGFLIQVLIMFWSKVTLWLKQPAVEVERLRWEISWKVRGIIKAFETENIAMYDKSREYETGEDSVIADRFYNRAG